MRERQDLVGGMAEARRRAQRCRVAGTRQARSRSRGGQRRPACRHRHAHRRDRQDAARQDFPDYAALASPTPLVVEEVQAQLGADEALVLFLDTPEWKPTPEETFIWVVTKTDMRWVRSELGTQALAERGGGAALRARPDALAGRARARARCADALQASPTHGAGRRPRTCASCLSMLARAHELYKALLGPVEDLIKGKHLLIVPSGPLTSLPFNVLVTEPPKAGAAGKLAELSRRRLARHAPAHHRAALGRLAQVAAPVRQGEPCHQALPRHRQSAARRAAAGPQVGRALQGAGGRGPRAAAMPEGDGPAPRAGSSRRRAQRAARLFRGPNADIEEVRQFSPLPETADELCEVGHRLGVPDGEILLGDRATEAALKDLSDSGRLADYAILHFATHGALTGQVQGAAEPGLILTPPPAGTSDPDGARAR